MSTNQDPLLDEIFQRLHSEYRAALRDFQFDFIDQRIIPALRHELEDQEALPDQFLARVRQSLEESFLSDEIDEATETLSSTFEPDEEFFELETERRPMGEDLTEFQRYVLAYLQLEDREREGVHVAYRDIAEYAKANEAQYFSNGKISEAFTALEEGGYIERERVSGNRVVKTNIISRIPNPEEALLDGNQYKS